MVTLVTEQKFKFGQTNIIPFAGEVSISSEGEIEVEQAIADQIVEAECGFNYKVQPVQQELGNINQDDVVFTTPTIKGGEPVGQINEQVEEDQLNRSEESDLGQISEEDLLKGVEDMVQNVVDPVDTLNTQEVYAALSAKTLGELKEMAKPFASKDWRDLNKTSLIEFLVSKTFS